MKLFRAPKESLHAAQAALLQAEDRIRQLGAERDEKLAAEGDYLGEVAKIDREIAALGASITAHRDRIAAMERRQRENERAQIEQRRVAAIAEINKATPRRQAAAERLDAALKEVADAFAALDAADAAVFANWSDVLPPAHRFTYLRMHVDALSTVRKPRMGYGLIRELASRAPYGLAAAAAERNRELLAELESSPAAELDEAA